MMKIPERIRRSLEKIVKKMRVRENVYGVGLFGSWSRGDAAKSSDIDLLILDEGNFDHEFVERIETDGLLIDLDHIPKAWFRSKIPPGLDQKLYELHVLYDRDWSLTNTKLLMAKSYMSPERVEIRTEVHIIESDVYLSRATSAFSREDFQSAHLFATVAMENILKVLVEIALQPLSASRFIQKLEKSARKLGTQSQFHKYLAITRLDEIDFAETESKLKLFKLIWDEIQFTAKANHQTLESSHFKIRTKLNYFLIPPFLQGTLMRARSLINSGNIIEAAHYLNDILVDLVENYAWLKSSIQKVKLDNTTLIRSLKKLEEKNPRNHMKITNFLNLDNIDKKTAAYTIEEGRKVITEVRKQRKALIKNNLRN